MGVFARRKRVDAMSKAGEKILKGAREALAYAKGEETAHRTHVLAEHSAARSKSGKGGGNSRIGKADLVDPNRIELSTSSLRTRRSPN
jgi:hypothetical protein